MLLGHVPDKVEVELSGNLIKNVQSVHIPNSEGLIGIESAVAMGIVLGDPNAELMVLSNVDTKRLPEVKEYVDKNVIEISKIDSDIKLHIRMTGSYGNDTVSFEIKNYHTNIVSVTKNGKELKDFTHGDTTHNFGDKGYDTSFLTVEYIYNLAKTIDISLVEPMFKRVIELNSAIANEGLHNSYGISIGKSLLEGVKEGVYSDDLKNKLIYFTAAGSDARMNGCAMPVITTSGSGNQGMTASLPVIKYCEEKKLPYEKLIRGLLFSHLVTVHIKSGIGRLSAYCGAICAGSASSGALAFVDDLSLSQVESAIETTIVTLSGIICDGANSSCATKIASIVGTAFDSYYLAKKNRKFDINEGINSGDIENTLDSVHTLVRDGLVTTDDVILDMITKHEDK